MIQKPCGTCYHCFMNNSSGHSGYRPCTNPIVTDGNLISMERVVRDIPKPPKPPENIKVSDRNLIPLGLIMYIGSIIVAGLIGYFIGVSV